MRIGDDIVNFNPNDSFNNSIFSSNNSLENNSANTDENNNLYDAPPVLDQIKNLNDAPTYEAPSMDALGLNSYSNENIKPSNPIDPLDAYENNGIDLYNFGSTSNNLNNTATNNVENNDFSFPKMDTNNQDKVIPNSSFETPNNSLNNTYNSDIFDSNGNIKQEILDNLGIKNTVTSEEKDKDVQTNEEDNTQDNKEEKNESKEYEIINRPILDQDPDSNIEDKTEDKNESTLEKDEESEKQEIPEEENRDELTDISSLGIDAYNEPDFLDITEDEESLSENEDSITKIKKLISDLTDKGEKIKLEEFDFENMHQLIIIIEKEEK